MDSLSSLIPFKSTTPIKNHPPAGPTLITPDRSQTRTQNRNFALSVSDVRRTALQLRTPNNGSGSDPSQRTRIGSSSGKTKRSDKSPTLLPQKYEVLCEFFDSMVSSIRLLRLKRQPATLANLSRNVESLTDRRFTLHHLAQLKHILPEIIVVKKIRVQDEVTGCMKEDLLVSLDVNAMETDKNARGSVGYSDLKGIFRSQIKNYVTNHPESDDVPEGELPELFYKPKQEPEPSMNQASVLRTTALMAPSFKRRFSSKALSAPVVEPVLAKPLSETPIKHVTSATVDSAVTPVEVASTLSKFDSTPSKCDSTPAKYTSTARLMSATPIQVASTLLKFESTPSKCDSTPAKYASTPARLMSATPALRTPKRSRMLDDDAAGLPNKSAKRRALKFEEYSDDAKEQPCQHSDDEIDIQVQNSTVSKDLLDVLPESLLHSLMEKERRTLEEQDPIVLQAQKRQQLMAGVPKLFDMIQLLFQSIRRSVMTKEQLIQKIITGHLDIVDKGEVEEQLKLLQEIAPEFITVKTCLSGDTLVRLNKSSCAESIRAKLLEAK